MSIVDILQSIGVVITIIASISSIYIALNKTPHEVQSTDANTVKVYSGTITEAGEQMRAFIKQISDLANEMRSVKNELETVRDELDEQKKMINDLRQVIASLKNVIIKLYAGIIVLINQLNDNKIKPDWQPEIEPLLKSILEEQK